MCLVTKTLSELNYKVLPKPPYLLHIHVPSLYQICTNFKMTSCANDFHVSEINVIHDEKCLP